MAPTIVGTGCLTKAEDWMINSVANSAAFQTWSGTANVTAAKARIYVDELPEPASGNDTYTDQEYAAFYPLCLIVPPEDGESIVYKHDAIGAGGWEYVEDIALMLIFEQFAGSGTHQDVARKFKNDIEAVIKDIRDQSGDQERFAFSTARPQGAPQRGYQTQYQALGDVLRWMWVFEHTVNI